MPWIREAGHVCAIPDDWAKHALGAVWRCPDCGQEWIRKRGMFDRRDHLFIRLITGEPL